MQASFQDYLFDMYDSTFYNCYLIAIFITFCRFSVIAPYLEGKSWSIPTTHLIRLNLVQVCYKVGIETRYAIA